MSDDARRPPQPPLPDAGPFRRSFWRSPLRGPWLASFLSAALLPLIVACAVTGLLSHLAYQPDLGHNRLFDAALPIYGLGWPVRPSWLYAFTQGVHIVSGLAAIPILLAKLWAVIPQLFERPAVRSAAHGLERIGLALLVGGSLFVFSTGVLNIQLYYRFGFSFVPAHYYAAIAFVAALAFHVTTKVTVARRAFGERGVVAPLRDDLEHTTPEPPLEGLDTTAPVDAAPATMSRRLLVGSVGAASLGLGLIGLGQTAGGPFRKLAFLAPRGDGFGPGPNRFQVNKTFASVGIPRNSVGDGWRLVVSVGGFPRMVMSRAELLALEQTAASLPIACVEGWSTTQRWGGVPVRELARAVGAEGQGLEVRSLQQHGSFRRASLNRAQVDDARSLLALTVNGADLSLDHGFPARLIVPALPGVHNTKWVAELAFTGGARVREKFRYEYGAGPAHLAAGVLAIGIGVWALVTVLGLVGRPFNVARWFAGSIVVHDLIALPIYSAIGVIAATVILRRKPTPIRLAALNHVRVPAMFSAVALLVWFPLILNKAPVTFARATGYRPDFYMGRWLTFTAVLFAVSAIIFCMRLPRLRASR